MLLQLDLFSANALYRDWWEKAASDQQSEEEAEDALLSSRRAQAACMQLIQDATWVHKGGGIPDLGSGGDDKWHTLHVQAALVNDRGEPVPPDSTTMRQLASAMMSVHKEATDLYNVTVRHSHTHTDVPACRGVVRG